MLLDRDNNVFVCPHATRGRDVFAKCVDLSAQYSKRTVDIEQVHKEQLTGMWLSPTELVASSSVDMLWELFTYSARVRGTWSLSHDQLTLTDSDTRVLLNVRKADTMRQTWHRAYELMILVENFNG